MAEAIEIEIPVTVEDNTDPALSNIAQRLDRLDRAAQTAANSMRRMSRGGIGSDRITQSMLGGMATRGGNGRSGNSRGTGLMQTILEAKDMATPTIQKVTSKLKSFEKKAWTATFKIASAPIRKVASAVTSPLMAAGASVSAGAMIGSSVKTYAGFESTMSQVKAISGATKEEFAQLTAKAKEMGATTKFTAQEAGEAFNYMAMAGWEPQQMLGGISGIMNLAAASGESLGTTSDIVTDALTAFGLKASDAGHFSDVLAQASSNANTNVGQKICCPISL